ncbi:MAG: hypothetical protein WCH07_11605 [Deltaproteobacteria bacterium]
MTKTEFRQAKAFIFTDIRREIRLAQVTKSARGKPILRKMRIPSGGGNFLAALGLLCYTEFGGKLKYNCKKKNGADHASENFNKFFDELGAGYRTFWASGVNVYNVFRCGLAHEYYVKSNCTIFMDSNIPGPGIGRNQNGSFYFIVGRYYEDLKNAFNRLETHLFP